MARPFRYTFILILVALGTCLAAVSGWRYARASAPVNGPIILISIDGLRADRLPAYGYRQGRTPAITALAADGVVFERALSHVPQTLPAHAAILSGRLPFETGVRDSTGFVVAADERLLPEMLRDRGYATAGIVSTFLLRHESGIDQGFSLFDADMTPGGSTIMGLSRDALQSEQVAEHWLDSVGTTRAFLFLQLNGARQPRPAVDPSTYDADVTNVDEAVGRLLRHLKAHQLYDLSTVILVSDHGEGLGDHGEGGHGLFVYDSTLRVPLIVKLPAGESAGRRVKSLVQHVDLVPTVLDLAKAPTPANLRGRSLMPVINRDGSRPDEPVYAESLFARYHFGWSGLVSITDGRYRFIAAPTEELYDLKSDPSEQVNLADRQPEVVASLKKTLAKLSPRDDPGAIPLVSDDDRERYDALGAVGVATRPAPPSTGPIDPKEGLDIVERYRAAVDLAVQNDWPAATDAFRVLAQRQPGMRDVWMLLGRAAMRADRFEIALDAFAHALPLDVTASDASLGGAAASLRLRRLDEADRHARRVTESDTALARSKAAGHELLARVALARRDEAAARAEAGYAEEQDAARPVRAYVEGRILFDQRRYTEALTWFDTALAQAETAPRLQPEDLRLYAAEAMARGDRTGEAEYLFLEELKMNPQNARARAGLAAVYRATGRSADAAALAQR